VAWNSITLLKRDESLFLLIPSTGVAFSEKEEKMAQEKGFVTSTTEDGWAQVVTERKDACGDCGASHCCVSFGSSSEIAVTALNRAGARAGDLVSVSLSSGAVVKGAAIVYLIPLAGLLSGALIGRGLELSLSISETGAVAIFGVAGLFLGFVITALLSRWMSAHKRVTPVITRIVKRGVEHPKSSTALDPVCKMAVNPAEAPASFLYRDKNYYFCQPSCRDAFIKEPEKYL
jgi:sigma-E factor negative regulatory protein RseC